jgi:hypothetical protein
VVQRSEPASCPDYGKTRLVTESMSPDYDWLDPTRDGFGDAGEDDRLAEDCSAQDIPDLDPPEVRPLSKRRK